MYVCSLCMYVCVYECMYVCMYICMYVRMYVCMYVCMYECMYVCIYVYMHACKYVRIHVCMVGWMGWVMAYKVKSNVAWVEEYMGCLDWVIKLRVRLSLDYEKFFMDISTIM